MFRHDQRSINKSRLNIFLGKEDDESPKTWYFYEIFKNLILYFLTGALHFVAALWSMEVEEAPLLSSEDPEWRHKEGYSMRYEEGRGTLAAWASVSQPIRGQGWPSLTNERPALSLCHLEAGVRPPPARHTPGPGLVLAKYSLASDYLWDTQQVMAMRVSFGLCLCIILSLSLQIEASPRVPIGKAPAGAKRAAGFQKSSICHD